MDEEVNEEGDADDLDNDPDVYNHASEEFYPNKIADANADDEAKEENNSKGSAPSIITNFWYEKVSEWIKLTVKRHCQ